MERKDDRNVRFECPWCSRTFSSRSHLKRHQRDSCDGGLHKSMDGSLTEQLRAMVGILESPEIPEEAKVGPIRRQIIAGLMLLVVADESERFTIALKEPAEARTYKRKTERPTGLQQVVEFGKRRKGSSLRLEMEFNEMDAFALLNAILGQAQMFAGLEATEVDDWMGGNEEVKDWMVSTVRLATDLYRTFTEAFPWLKEDPAIEQWWDDAHPKTARPYREEYQRFLATYAG